MKKPLVTLLLILFGCSLWAQEGDVVLCQGFYGSWLDEEWEVSGDEWVVWYLSNTSEAGGKSHEMLMYPDYNFDGTTRLSTPKVNLSDYDYIDIQFNNSLSFSQGSKSCCIGIATSADGESWQSIWEDTISQGYIQTQFTISFDLEEWASKTNRFSFYFRGQGSSVNQWFIDNIIIYASKEKLLADKRQSRMKNGWLAVRSSREDPSLFGYAKKGQYAKLNRMKRTNSRYGKIVGGRKN